MHKILIIEDDAHINAFLTELLTRNGYATVSAYSGTEALLLLSQSSFALVLLDLMLPGKTGEQVLEAMRATSDTPVIVLTAKADKETTVQLLQLGADDYLCKPFDNDELLARINARLRRGVGLSTAVSGHLVFKDIMLDVDRHTVSANNIYVDLSKREFEILRLMMAHPQKVFTKNNLYESVWGGDYLGDDNTINVHISKLRSKLNAANPHCEYIQTVWGIGFKMKE